MRAFVGFITHV